MGLEEIIVMIFTGVGSSLFTWIIIRNKAQLLLEQRMTRVETRQDQVLKILDALKESIKEITESFLTQIKSSNMEMRELQAQLSELSGEHTIYHRK